MIIAVDGMGGDNSPKVVVKACVESINENSDLKLIITGSKDVIENELAKYTYDNQRIELLNAEEVIGVNEHPVMAIRKKKDSSLRRAIELVRDKKADAVLSAGSTGAFMAGGLFILGRMNGVDRPALGPIMPGVNGKFMIIDAGANAECKPENLVQFAIMGKVYMQNIMNITNPSVGLINIGAEEEKGNELTKKAYKLLKEENLNFIGNVEARDISSGDVDILVCDGFVGNTVLKMYEGVVANIFTVLKNEMVSSFKTKIGALLLKPVFRNFKVKYNYKEVGGAAFLGVNGLCVKAHGNSDIKAFKQAIKQCNELYNHKVLDKIKEELEKVLNI
jgi:glycerol-3-phosphate acyltransferase PlsX